MAMWIQSFEASEIVFTGYKVVVRVKDLMDDDQYDDVNPPPPPPTRNIQTAVKLQFCSICGPAPVLKLHEGDDSKLAENLKLLACLVIRTFAQTFLICKADSITNESILILIVLVYFFSGILKLVSLMFIRVLMIWKLNTA